MSVVRGTSLTGFSDEVSTLGAEPSPILRRAGIRPGSIGDFDTFFTYVALIDALESAAAVTGAHDFGRRLARRQGIEILGPVGVAARTTSTVAEALSAFETYLSAYSPAITVQVQELPDTEIAFLEFRLLIADPPPHRQVIELSLGVTLRVLRFLLGTTYSPLTVHVPHEPLGDRTDYLHEFSCTPRFSEPRAGFTLQASDLARPLAADETAHRAIVTYLDGVIDRHDRQLSGSVRDLVRQLLPTGAATLPVTARQFRLHPKTLQRRLAAEGTTFAAVVDDVRRELAERWLRETDMTLSHLAHELGYAEQSVLTRSCRRWFGVSPARFRHEARATRPLTINHTSMRS
ncbi:AraC family transcriptional regulator [Gordonia sp. PKS22-38]|uniref:AraC family transcriptional regulator n=1 Tax=Gordonia prachuapensis TaxID=3115651 RepID=A0ABU7MT84_9ACTN|nr:AraC family transcriptional regulator [Gordonia sp. PKS22-38]